MKKYEFHEIANCWPLIEGDDFQKMLADVKEHGVREQGVLLDGKILDGRNRYRAAQGVGAEMSFRNFEKQIDGDCPIAFAKSVNDIRRQMSASQRAMTAAKLANLSEGRPKKTPSNDGVSQEQAAKALGVSTPSVERAARVLHDSPASVVKAVESGEVKVSDAAAVADEPKAVQAKALKAVQAGEARTMKAAVKELEPKHKSGKQTFDPRPFERIEKHLGGALRMADDLNKSHPAAKFHRDTLAGIKTAMREVEDWRKAVRK